MKKYITIIVALLFCLIIQVRRDFAQTPPDVGVLNDKAKTLAKPVDPFDVTYGNLSGTVNVKITVNEKGIVTKAEAISGDEQLRYAAVIAAQESKFSPFIVKGKPIKVKGLLIFEFGSQNKSNLEEFIRKSIEDGNTKTEAQRLYDKGDYNGAIKILTKIVDNAFFNTTEKAFRARCYFKLKDYKNALQDINDAINITKKDTPASTFALQADIYIESNNFPKAIESYTKVIELDPKNTDAFGNRGYAYAKLSKKMESNADFKRVIEIDPKDKYAIYNLDALANDRKVLSREEYKKLRQIYYV